MKKVILNTLAVLTAITLVLIGAASILAVRMTVIEAEATLASDSSSEISSIELASEAASTDAEPEEAAAESSLIAAAEKEEPDTPEVPEEVIEPDTVTVVMVGDILLHMPIENASKDENGNYDFNPIFANMKDEIIAADIAIVNQEVIIGGEELGISGYPCFNAPYPIGDALVNAGFDVVLHATNHALDKGKTGLMNTINYWRDNHPDITVLGINETEEDKERVDIIEKNGIKIAILNYTYGTNGIPMPGGMPYAVDLLEEEKVKQDLAYAEENADFTIVCPHWGTEYNLGTDNMQQKWAAIFREGGADLVIGAHPHVIEPVEFMEDEAPGHSNNHGGGDMLVYYSLGNFVSWTSSSGPGITKRMVGGMANVTIEKEPEGEAVISDHSVEALVAHLSRQHNGVSVYRLTSYTEEQAATNAIDIQDNSFSRQQCVDICHEVWGMDWK
ncbi:CapA family protein [Butyrivibrio sp. MC2021]|uniref:CapA family protein n=1 Tax=Butyrivibrio sp. MC2021 TaxID=1408306 RepID=UPI000687ED19|nr:CapA family protein [Butyrivibrio sp. MC2021]